MFYAFLILIAIGFFAFGYRLGSKTQPKVRLFKAKPDSEQIKLRKEYENFLNYDGNEQS